MATDDRIIESGDSLEDLFRRAAPRRMPPAADAGQVRCALHSEWRKMSGRRRVARRIAGAAVAATVLLTIGLTITLLRAPSAIPVPAATLVKSVGPIYLLGDGAELTETDELAVLNVGQTIVTGHDSGAGLVWHRGGQLRIDRDTRIELLAGNAIGLRSGRVYYDSRASLLSAGMTSADAGAFEIRTELGVVTHHGTQFMAEHLGDRLAVSVREGEVHVAGTHHAATAAAGQRLSIEGRSRPTLASIPRHGDAWAWVETTATPEAARDPTIYDFLSWAGRETGLGLRFATPAAERIARRDRLMGQVDTGPTEALRLWMSTVDLAWRIEDGVIIISEK
ncbi:MAG: FecR domain-containing protein [Woeseiaceae bacterium]